MNDLTVIEKNGGQWINARDLHGQLEVGRDFSNWIKDRIKKLGFVAGRDYQNSQSPNLATGNSGHTGGKPSFDKGKQPQQREILNLLSRTVEAWITPEMVRQRAVQMGVAGGLTEAQAAQLAAIPSIAERLERIEAAVSARPTSGHVDIPSIWDSFFEFQGKKRGN